MKIQHYIILTLLAIGCQGTQDFDASGYFTADQIMISAQTNGTILDFIVHEGDLLEKGQIVGHIDTELLELQKQQLQASFASLNQKTSTPTDQVKLIQKQIQVQNLQYDHLVNEQKRTLALIKADAATTKTLDDLNTQIKQLEQQIAASEQQIVVSIYNTAVKNSSILSEGAPLQKAIEQVDKQIKQGTIINPIKATVLTTYALPGEYALVGKPLYSIANIDTLELKAYITLEDLNAVKIGQQATIYIEYNQPDSLYKTYEGKLTWISQNAEFTPKSIQTRQERSNNVYAVKFRVKNDGYIKIGMFGQVNWHK